MAGMCCGVVGEDEVAAKIETSGGKAKRRRMEIRHLKYVPEVVLPIDDTRKRSKNEFQRLSMLGSDFDSAIGFYSINIEVDDHMTTPEVTKEDAKFGVTSICGRRRDMEDAVAIHPLFFNQDDESLRSHFYGVFDGHGCSHVAVKCKDRLKDLLKEELEGSEEINWQAALKRSFLRMDEEVHEQCNSHCKCEMRTPRCDAVGSTALVAIVTPDKLIVSNCGDSRAVLCRNGMAIPLSIDHKPDRPDELQRIHDAGGRVIYWDVPRVIGVLAMSRAIGDEYLKPYVIAEPEVTMTDRVDDDEFLILASDGLWDVVDNVMACAVAGSCLRSRKPPLLDVGGFPSEFTESSEKACSDASIVLTKLALGRNSNDNVSVIVVDLRKGR